jgi:Adenylate and Guanylate cyclase catalytic domain
LLKNPNRISLSFGSIFGFFCICTDSSPVVAGELQQIAIKRRAKVEEFQRKHRAGLLTLLFTDIVDSTKLKQTFGDREAVTMVQRHHAVIREILGRFSEGEEIETLATLFSSSLPNPRMR